MREIKFRGKCVDNGKWVHGFLFELSEECGHSLCIGIEPLSANDYSEIYKSCYDVIDPETVGQYTGLQDKNGKEIYERDILMDSRGWMCVVKWDNDNGRFLGYHEKPGGDTYICYVGREPAQEVIGNIYDNQDLLKT